jgi:hypothetical protein
MNASKATKAPQAGRNLRGFKMIVAAGSMFHVAQIERRESRALRLKTFWSTPHETGQTFSGATPNLSQICRAAVVELGTIRSTLRKEYLVRAN